MDCTLKTGVPIEDGHSILKSFQRVSLSETTLSVRMNQNEINCNGSYFSSQVEIAYFLTQEAVHLLVYHVYFKGSGLVSIGRVPIGQTP